MNRGQLLQAIGARPPMPQFNAYSAGAKSYGSGRPAPNMGRTPNKTGYARRDAMRRAITGGN